MNAGLQPMNLLVFQRQGAGLVLVQGDPAEEDELVVPVFLPANDDSDPERAAA